MLLAVLGLRLATREFGKLNRQSIHSGATPEKSLAVREFRRDEPAMRYFHTDLMKPVFSSSSM